MKILHLLGSTEDNGGILSIIRNLHSAGQAHGEQHVVWVNVDYRETRGPQLEYRTTRHLRSELPGHAKLLWLAWRSLPELRRLLAAEPFDVLHAHTRGGFAVACHVAGLWRRPVVFTNHTYGRRRAMYRHASRLRWLTTVVLTPNMARYYGLKVDERRVHQVSECCSNEYFGLPLAAPRPAGSRPIRLVGLGNIVPWKKWDLIIAALGSLPPVERDQFEFHHWGPVPNNGECVRYHETLVAACRRLELTGCCRFHGASSNVPSVLAAADFFVLPSTNEPCSVALIEALALGVPAVVSASGGNVDLVQPNRTGLLFEPDSVPSLADSLRTLLRADAAFASPAEIRGSVGFRSATQVRAQYRALYDRLLADARRG